MHLINRMHIFYILEKLHFYNQYLVIKMAMDLNQMRTKISNIRSFLVFKIAKRFAPNLFAPHYHTNICKVTIRIWTPPAMLHVSVTILLLFVNYKREASQGWFIPKGLSMIMTTFCKEIILTLDTTWGG